MIYFYEVYGSGVGANISRPVILMLENIKMN